MPALTSQLEGVQHGRDTAGLRFQAFGAMSLAVSAGGQDAEEKAPSHGTDRHIELGEDVWGAACQHSASATTMPSA